jgi:hypothetical protein
MQSPGETIDQAQNGPLNHKTRRRLKAQRKRDEGKARARRNSKGGK